MRCGSSRPTPRRGYPRHGAVVAQRLQRWLREIGVGKPFPEGGRAVRILPDLLCAAGIGQYAGVMLRDGQYAGDYFRGNSNFENAGKLARYADVIGPPRQFDSGADLALAAPTPRSSALPVFGRGELK